MKNTDLKNKQPDAADVKRGPNEEAVSTALENVSQGYGSSGKASIISGKPDRHAESENDAQTQQGKP